MDIRKLYDDFSGSRNQYLMNSEAVARITLPDITDERYASHFLVGGTSRSTNRETINGGNITEGIYNNSGTLAVSGLAAALHRTTFPSQADWFRLSLDEEITQRLLAGGVRQADIDDALTIKTNQIKRLLARMNFQSAVGRIFQRIIIEDNVVVVVTPDGIRAIPMRNAVVRREAGRLKYVIWREETTAANGNVESLYYLADYDNNVCYTQRGTSNRSTRVSDLNPKRVFVVTSHLPDWGSYSTSYAFKNYGLIYTLNNLSYNLLRAATIASKSIMCIDPNSGLTPQQVATVQGGSCIVGEASAIQWISSGIKINDWAWVQNYINEMQQRLNRAFALDLLNMQFNQPRTATEVQAVTSAIDSQVASLASSIADTFARPLVAAAMDILNTTNPSTDLLANTTPVITSGTSAFDNLMEYQKLLQGLAAVAQFDPTLAQRIDSVQLLRTFSNATGINTEQFIREIEQPVNLATAPMAPSSPAAFLPPQGGFV